MSADMSCPNKAEQSTYELCGLIAQLKKTIPESGVANCKPQI